MLHRPLFESPTGFFSFSLLNSTNPPTCTAAAVKVFNFSLSLDFSKLPRKEVFFFSFDLGLLYIIPTYVDIKIRNFKSALSIAYNIYKSDIRFLVILLLLSLFV